MLAYNTTQTTPATTVSPNTMVWAALGKDAERYISNSHVEMMLAMTKRDVHDTVVMAFGYIIQALDLQARHQRAKASEYRSQIEYYRNLLQRHM